ncbi:hypothetical protein GCM10010112_87190 [Actinoplanes lobatus]|uniref:HK97 gp10 family phage protein n=1 Tax=Actinoplanes lobatus TaxID=113568 RepID=A0A7W7HC08_9ACTN|nr:hypothetical protein [Actinoplanes lobatus]MBB4747746.1 hypothetical protein [Actinoplanes lobatus]GGN96182.1 hypothetical protein GCM10010112_87190 [Actinoplanes lobatus]GIE45183.1 hypothetical protein Alo02nite_80810 [Actinoplanes lobatus]
MPAGYTTDLPDALARLARALETEGSARFRRQLARNLKQAADPGAAAVRARVMAIPSRGGPRRGGSIRRAIAQAVRVDVLLAGKTTGVRIAIGKNTMPRGFHNAAKRFNQRTFRRPVYGRGEVTQRGQPYFENTLQAGRPRYAAACHEAMDDMADRIASRIH